MVKLHRKSDHVLFHDKFKVAYFFSLESTIVIIYNSMKGSSKSRPESTNLCGVPVQKSTKILETSKVKIYIYKIRDHKHRLNWKKKIRNSKKTKKKQS